MPKDATASLPIHNIPDGSSLSDPTDLDNMRLWPGDDGINILGNSLGSSDFVESYLFGKGIKHRQLLSFTTQVAAARFPREAVAMLTWAVGPRLSHLLKSIEKNAITELFMREMDTARVSTWLQCLSASPDMEHSLDSNDPDGLTDWLDLPPSLGGSGLNSLSRSAEEELLGSFAGIAASLISFCMETD